MGCKMLKIIESIASTYTSKSDMIEFNNMLVCAYTMSFDCDRNSETRIIYQISKDGGESWERHELVPVCRGVPYWDNIKLSKNQHSLYIFVNSVEREDVGVEILYFKSSDLIHWSNPKSINILGVLSGAPLFLNNKSVLIPIHSKNRKTGYYQQKIYYSDNFEAWHQCSKLPFLEYHDFCDSQLYSVDNELGLLMREKSVNNWDMFCSKSNDDGITWDRPLKVPFKGCSRPKIEIYQNKLIVFFSFDKLENMKLNNKVVIAISNLNEFHKTPYRCNFSTYTYTDLYGDQNCELCLGNAGCIYSETGDIITTTYFVKNNIGNIAVNILKGSGLI